MNKNFKINGKDVGIDHSPYVISEMSGNHNQNINRALEIIKAAKTAGADAVKLQTYTPDTITLNHDGPGFTSSGLWDGRRLYDLYKEAMTPWEWHKDMFDYAKEIDITIFSSPFDYTAVDLLEKLDTPAYKIASFEIVDIPLIKYAASTGKPLIISSGLANLEEMHEAIEAAASTGNQNIAMLHCVSGYPAPLSDCNLNTINDMQQKLDVMIGLSDHSYGISIPVAAIALGATIVEKHMTLRRADGGVDSDFSLEPEEFSAMTQACREAKKALGTVNYNLKESEKKNLNFRRSLYACKDIKKGEALSNDNIRSVRPGLGLPPKFMPEIIGKTASTDIAFGTPIQWDLLHDRSLD